MKRTTLILSLSLLVVIIAAIVMNSTDLVDAQEQPPPTPSAYVDLLETEIRGLSPEQIETYRTGGGGGMALPAELNGYPGPRHVLDLVDDLELTDDQRSQIQALYDEMLPEAIDLGNQILAAEAELELAFRERNIDEAILENQLVAIGELQAQLRFVHLRTHLATIDVLTQHQVVVYNSLRGYDIENPHRHGGH
jgi:Spy/CpxP family protein refolding chaperone